VQAFNGWLKSVARAACLALWHRRSALAAAVAARDRKAALAENEIFASAYQAAYLIIKIELAAERSEAVRRNNRLRTIRHR